MTPISPSTYRDDIVYGWHLSFSITVLYYTFTSKLNFDHKMLLFILTTFLLFIGSTICVFPIENEGLKDYMSLNNWALTQVLIYYAEEFDSRNVFSGEFAPGSWLRFFRKIVWFDAIFETRFNFKKVFCNVTLSFPLKLFVTSLRHAIIWHFVLPQNEIKAVSRKIRTIFWKNNRCT